MHDSMIVVRSCIPKSEFSALLAAKEGAAAVKYETDGWKKASQQTQDFCRTPPARLFAQLGPGLAGEMKRARTWVSRAFIL